ncbi:hypothetical protein B0T25DRAFT_455604 [Lasiosphaeria hispida]|uniref:Putative transcription factor kapC n=1 Tax=Lasiosphaeria hispida TaxID=260671 RepID=A0AAJ0HI08_9PEZI|nr:hypothetical protein B0T25DRAFT_455604 [Lasiosphaeria hispida]
MSSPLSPVGAPSMGGMDSDNTADGRKAKRELSQSKRAAQNRAAQRAFRQRKEHYIKKLEQQVREYGEMENGYKTIQTENYALREYVIHLQSRLLDTQGEYPQPPPNINLAHPHSQAPPAPVSESQHGSAGSNPLEVAAQAVAGLSRSEHLAASRESYAAKVYEQVRAEEDARTAEEITRQLADGAPDALSTASM